VPRRTPWLPEPRPATPGAASATASLVLGAPDWLAERLLDRRVIALAGEVDDEVANRTVAELALLDATDDEPIELRLSGVTAGLDAALSLVDALDLVGAPVHATALGTLTGAAVALLAVADTRVLGAHATLHLTEPRSPAHLGEVESAAAEHARRVRRLQERIADACGRDVEQVAAEMRTGRLLTAAEARDYGLADAVAEGRR
jgi:ATP-dependent Clp protease protease subunit